MLVEMWNPKMLIKLVITTEIQELELNTDANTVNPLFSPPSQISPPTFSEEES